MNCLWCCCARMHCTGKALPLPRTRMLRGQERCMTRRSARSITPHARPNSYNYDHIRVCHSIFHDVISNGKQMFLVRKYSGEKRVDRVSLRQPIAAGEWYSINSQDFSGLPVREGCNARMMHSWRSEQGSCTCRTMSIWLRDRSPRAVSVIENGRWTAHARKCRVFELNGCGRRESEQWTQEGFRDARNNRDSIPAN